LTGLVTIESSHSVKDTIDRLVTIVESKGLTVFARIDHAANAKKVGMDLRATELVIFGNPKAGTVLMQDQQTAGIDLPVKALAWEDDKGTVWLTYNDTLWITERHGLTGKSAETIVAIEQGMKEVARRTVENIK
jgi:uncharacterized protein (DUF302 family)